MKDPRRLPYRTAPQLLPKELVGKAFPCDNCGTNLEVPWLEKLPFPKQPIEPNGGGGHFVPVSIPLWCTNEGCGHETWVNIPAKPNEATWTLYGDEAGRYIAEPSHSVSKSPLHFFCITLTGLHKDSFDEVSREIQSAKLSIKPDEDPNSWVHHFTEIWNCSPKRGVFDLPSKDAKIEYGHQFASIIRNVRPALVSFTITSCISVPKNKKKRKEAIKWQKQEIFCQAILTTLKQMRNFNKSVRWVFDNIKDSTYKSATEGWASECFLGLQYTRLFTWLTAGATTLEPEFVKPGSHLLLEISDFISYCVAREFEMAAKGAQTEFPSSMLGKAFYQGTIRDGSVYYMWNTGLPIQEYYGLAPSK